VATRSEPTGLNAGYVGLLLEQYLENPEAVDPAWRELFERADDRGVSAADLQDGNGAAARSELAPEDASPSHSEPAAAPTEVRSSEAPVLEAPLLEAISVEKTAASSPPKAPLQQAATSVSTDLVLLQSVASAMALVDAIRSHGHLAARLDPLGSEPLGDPALEESELALPLPPELQAQIPASLLGVHVEGETLADVLPRLREVYCGTIAYEIEHIADHAERAWLRRAIESGSFRQPLSAEQRRALLVRLAQVEAFETYLRRAFIGQKQFSIEGLDVLVPMLDEAIELAAAGGAHEVVVGIAHRGRLNVLAHTVGRSYESILREFEGERTIDALVSDPEGGTGDVKYHLAASETRVTGSGEVQVTLAANPSHLEAVDPVVEGLARAEQTDRSRGAGIHDPTVALPVLIHGDASFAGQGVVAETFNLHSVEGYSTGGTLHVIANNQIGFTTEPTEGRSTRYSSDLAKGFDVPIVHVNADDPEAALAATRLALAYREEFGHDLVIDLVGYRRFGHNEQDEAAYTQPLMAGRIDGQAPVRESYARRLVADGVIGEDEAAQLLESTIETLRETHDHLRASFAEPDHHAAEPRRRTDTGEAVMTAVPAERLLELNEQLLRVPERFDVNPKLAKQLDRRREALREGGIDWGQAEALAFASLLEEGIPIRLSGQDTERGTFSHRHAVLHDSKTGETYTPLQQLPTGAAAFEIYNSPLSEYAALAFEHGYSIAAPDALVLWEAQFGDFINGAQIVVDQFIVSGRSKWGQTSRLVLLLPHGYEGSGPEHSSARLERFLQLAAQENIRIANCTTAAQFFHLLRRQALDATARPLVVMTPKGLLRLREATSTIEDLSTPSFRPVLDDPRGDRLAIRRLILCSGKIYYDIAGHDVRGLAPTAAVARIELLYPFPVDAVARLVESYPEIREIVWAQEEPQNMGAWRSIRHRLEAAAAHAPYVENVIYVGRPWRASPSEGYPTFHQREQDRIVREALGFRTGN
jgi:2-oxoglutarate dehydrogenase E1 component